jgi:DNA-binding transcriptional LysR family regulator
MIELRLLRHALALSQFRNFARAAEALDMAQPTLSRSIAALESGLGVRLFDRGRKSLEPTAFGRVLLERSEALLSGEADLRREIQLLAGLEAGYLTIGAGPYPGEVSVATAAARLVSAHPRLRMEVLTVSPREVVTGVLAGRFDVGVADVGALDDEPRLRLQPLGPHQIYLACRPGHPLTRIRDLTLEKVLAFPLVSTLMRGDVATTAARGGALGSADPHTGDFTPAIHVNSYAVARQIARQSDALFPGALSMLAPDVEAGHLVRLAFHIPVMRTSYRLMHLRDRTVSPAAQAFMDLLLAVEAELMAREAEVGRVARRRREVRRHRPSTRKTASR